MVAPNHLAVAAAIERSVSAGRFDDALTLAESLVDSFVPQGDDIARQTLLGTSALCADLGRDPELNERAIGLLRRAVAAVPAEMGTQLEWALCTVLTDLGTLYSQCRTAGDMRQRTLASVSVCDDIVARWSGSEDIWLRLNATGAMLNMAVSLLELGDEQAARREYVRVVESCAADAATDGETKVKFGARLSVARHALEILDSMRLPAPELNTGFIDAMTTKGDAHQYLDAARRLHDRTADFVRHASCVGEPWVLVLRNFELTFTAIVRPADGTDEPEHLQIARSPVGLSVLNRLVEATNVVQVANTNAAALDLNTETTEFMGHGEIPRLLYLPAASWLDTVRLLVALAECVVVWVGEKTPALMRELAVVTELGRTEDTVVLLDEIHYAPGLRMRPPGEALTSDDPVLAGFPIVVRAEQVSADPGPFVRDVVGAIAAAQQLPMPERVARIRRRLSVAEREAAHEG